MLLEILKIGGWNAGAHQRSCVDLLLRTLNSLRRLLMPAAYGLLLTLMASSPAGAATYYWVGNSGASTNTGANWKTTDPAGCGGGNGAAPTVNDDLIFDPDCDNNAAIDTDLTVNSITMQSGYAGTVTQNSGIVIEVRNGLTATGGTFTGGDARLDVVGDFLLNGATFTSTSDTFIVVGNFTISSGTFNPNGGTVTMASNGAKTMTTGGRALNNLTVNDGLRSYWKLDETAAGTFANSSANGFIQTGTGAGAGGSNNTPQPSASVPPGDFANPRSVNFDGTDDYISVPNSIMFDLAGDMTISAWINPHVTAGNVGIFLESTNSGFSCTADVGGFYWAMENRANARCGGSACNGMSFEWGGGSAIKNVTARNVLANDTWQHVLVTIASDGTAGLYVDGVSKTIDYSEGVYVGGITAGGGALDFGRCKQEGVYYNGYVDDVRIYNRVLSASEISTLAAGKLPRLAASGSSLTLQDALDIDGDLILNSGTLDTKSGSDFAVHVGGNWENNGAVFTPRGGTVTLDAASGTKALKEPGSFNHLTVNDGGGTATYRLDTKLDVGGNLTIAGGTLDASTGNFSVFVSGNWSNADTFTPRSGSVIFNGTGGSTLTSGGQAFYDLIVNDGLLAYWKFDETAADSCAGGVNDSCDASGNGYDAAWAADAAASATVPAVRFTDGRSVTFDGTGDYVNVTLRAQDALEPARLTVAAWVRRSAALTSLNGIFSSRKDSSAEGGYILAGTAANKIRFYIWDGAWQLAESDSAISADTWYHVAGTYDGATVRLYVNGVLQSSTDTAASIVYTGTIGQHTIGNYNNALWQGQIDDLRIYDRALSGGEIGALARGEMAASAASGSSVTLQDALDVNHSLIINAGNLDVKSGSDYAVALGGAWMNNGGQFTARSGTVTLDGTAGTSVVQAGQQPFYNLAASGSGGTWQLGQDVIVSNNLTISGGALDFNGYDAAVTGNLTNSSGSLSLGAGTSSVSGAVNFTGGSVTPSSSTLVLSPDGAKNFTSGANSLNDLVLSGSDAMTGRWTLDEASSPSGDSASGAHDGTWAGGAAHSALTAPVNFVNAGSIALDGTGDYITMGDVDAADLTDTADLSVSGWFWRSAFTTDDTIVAKRNGQSAADAGWIIYIDDATDKLVFEISDGTHEYELASTSTFTAAGWNHFVVTWDQDSPAGSRMYINGADDAAAALGTIGDVGDASGALDLRIGAESDGGAEFIGYLDDIRLYNRVLTAPEAAALWRGHPLSSSGSVALQDAMDVNGDVVLGDGTLAAGANTIAVGGNWTMRDAAFDYGTSTVNFDDDTKNNVFAGATTFYNLEITTAAAKTATFESGAVQSIASGGLLRLTGASSNLLTLAPSTAATAWLFSVDPAAAVDVQYANVSYSDASGGKIIHAANSANGGNNVNWAFDPDTRARLHGIVTFY